MVVVINRGNIFRLAWCCSICHRGCTLNTVWLAFPATSEPTRGRWVHKPCVDGQGAELFNTEHIVLMRGLPAVRLLARR